MKEITGICIACGAYQSLKPPQDIETFDLEDFWRHSVATGVVSRRLCQELEILDHNVLYFLGLLHDVGKVVLDRFAHDIYKVVVRTARDENITIQEAEKRLIGESHDVVGGWLMEKWKLPWTFVDIARYHHAVAESPDDNKSAVAIISFADRLAWLHYLGLFPDFDVALLTNNEAYSFLEGTSSTITDIDLLKFMRDLDTTHEEIDEMTRIFHS
jgi:putative nucleotidyltransferase with HDIG domain